MASILSQVEIRRFKSLSSVELNLAEEPVSLLIGGNNSGKSSVLQSLHFGVSVAQTAKLLGDQAGISWRVDKYELSFSPAQLLYSPVADAMTLAPGGNLVEDATQRIEIIYTTTTGTVCTVAVRRGRNRNISVAIEGRILGEELQSIESPFTVYAPGLAGIAKDEEYRSPGVLRRYVARGDANLVLRNVLLQLSKNTAAWKQFHDDLQEIFPGLRVQIEFSEDSAQHVVVQFVTANGTRLPFESAGTAILQCSQIFAYICLYSPSLLLLDEPDSHLHPNNQKVLCQRLVAIAQERGFRIIASSHSRHVLDALRDSNNIIWMHQGQADVVESVESVRILMDLGALDSVDYFADGETKWLVATEDSDTSMLEAVLEASGFPSDSTTVASYGGCTNTQAVDVLAKLLQEKAPAVQFILHRDRDYMDDDEVSRLTRSYTASGAKMLMFEGNDIESLFVNAEHIADLNEGVSKEDVEQAIEYAVVECKSKSIEAIVNDRTKLAYARRSRDGTSVNAGQIATQANKDYESNPRAFSRGKVLLGVLKDKLQQKLGHHPRIVAPTHHLEQDMAKQYLLSSDSNSGG